MNVRKFWGYDPSLLDYSCCLSGWSTKKVLFKQSLSSLFFHFGSWKFHRGFLSIDSPSFICWQQLIRWMLQSVCIKHSTISRSVNSCCFSWLLSVWHYFVTESIAVKRLCPSVVLNSLYSAYSEGLIYFFIRSLAPFFCHKGTSIYCWDKRWKANFTCRLKRTILSRQL